MKKYILTLLGLIATIVSAADSEKGIHKVQFINSTSHDIIVARDTVNDQQCPIVEPGDGKFRTIKVNESETWTIKMLPTCTDNRFVKFDFFVLKDDDSDNKKKNLIKLGVAQWYNFYQNSHFVSHINTPYSKKIDFSEHSQVDKQSSDYFDNETLVAYVIDKK